MHSGRKSQGNHLVVVGIVCLLFFFDTWSLELLGSSDMPASAP
jgi:hypothetical protein